ncbi:MAG: hypothetical protein A3E00_10660 [Curvibacter sp. RIFCSPHIGHO2_12_FULL_63_18]|uniref:hypothetical protein n=1 Tax=Rhodoferax sp. TaxID=50421 RepID=UPI0008B1EC9D|nr:hypothetical protein [Rhodoferax sp.]OGO98283.1 MAG: hypothetical protein A2037_06735 [Curvibacter sp. GWA2_63_95]OGP03908.1 MAG: hypothetical protein A3E00_10660 [Curvibacter sp. RIFCSPHIGHO2_12_FULL_63_18]HCX82972.1 hypothetical protein [Rhodoferax sp.]
MKKSLLALAAFLVLLIAGGALWLHGNLDGLVQAAIGKYGSAMTGATVKVAAVKLKAADGQGALKGLIVGNPAGFKTPYAVKADTIELEVDVASLTKDVVLVKKIVVLAPEVIYEKGEAMTNFDALQKNITTYLGPSTSSGPGKKLIVQEFTIRGAKAQASAAVMDGKTVTVALPDIQLRDLGKAKGGLTPGELGLEITNALEKRLTIAVNFEKLANSVGAALEKAGNAIKGFFK